METLSGWTIARSFVSLYRFFVIRENLRVRFESFDSVESFRFKVHETMRAHNQHRWFFMQKNLLNVMEGIKIENGEMVLVDLLIAFGYLLLSKENVSDTFKTLKRLVIIFSANDVIFLWSRFLRQWFSVFWKRPAFQWNMKNRSIHVMSFSLIFVRKYVFQSIFDYVKRLSVNNCSNVNFVISCIIKFLLTLVNI